MKNYGDKFPDMSLDMYEEFFEIYNYNMVEDFKSHFSYEDWSAVLENINIDEAMNDNQMAAVMEYVRAKAWKDMAQDEELKKYLRRI